MDRLVARYEKLGSTLDDREITRILFSEDIHRLNDVIAMYLEEKEEVWLLIDNLDKGWPTRGASPEDILILRTLLEATRKIQRQLERKGVNFHCLVFLRNDIYEHLVQETPDKGKDTAITLDWSDDYLFQEVFRRRVVASGLLTGSFSEVWPNIFEPNVGMRDSFSYVIERTLMRPRDFLTFIHRAIEVAINRGHDRVYQDDLLQAEKWYSEDILRTTAFELKDIYSEEPDFLYVFLGSKISLSKREVLNLLSESALPEDRLEEALDLLVWFGFLGVQTRGSDSTNYAYQIRYDMPKLMRPIERGIAFFVIHPAFRSALECQE